MRQQIHGHEVMEMMIESGKVYTRESLRADILAKFGDDARFYTCSASNLNAEELIAFLQARGKFVDAAGGLTTQPGKLCEH